MARAGLRSYDRKVKLWRVADGSLIRTLNGHSAPVKLGDVFTEG